MMNQKISQQNWNGVKGEIQKSFSSLSAEDLEITHGDPNLLTELVTKKSGLNRVDAEKRLDEIVARFQSEAAAASFYDEDDFDDYIADADDERFGTDEGLTSPKSHSFGAGSSKSDRSEERIPRQDSTSPSERRGPDRNPTSPQKKSDRSM